MIKSIKKWLTKELEVGSSNIESYFQDNNVTGFLIIWSIFEQKLFDGKMIFNKIKDFSEKNQSVIYSELELAEIFNSFHARYQDVSMYNNLIHQDKNEYIKKIKIANADEITNEDRLIFILYVVYRYRNNIFHGNKNVKSWSKYKEQIDHCVIVMTKLIEIHNV